MVAQLGRLRPPSLRRHNEAMRTDRPETVTASEIASWVYCPEAWRLDALGLPAANQQERTAGTRHHAEKATAERTAGGAIAFGFGLIAMAVLAISLLWWLRR